jgi:hypothetical protein
LSQLTGSFLFTVDVHVFLQCPGAQMKYTISSNNIETFIFEVKVQRRMGVEVLPHPFLNFALDGGEWPSSRPGHFTPRERAAGRHWIGGWLRPRAGLDAVAKRMNLCSSRESKPGRLAHSAVTILTELSRLLVLTFTTLQFPSLPSFKLSHTSPVFLLKYLFPSLLVLL